MFICLKFKYLIYVAVPGLSCGTWDLLVVTRELLVTTVVSSSLSRDWTQGPLHWDLWVLAPGPPGMSLYLKFKTD